MFYNLHLGSIGIVLLIFLFFMHGLIFFTLLLLSYGFFEKKRWARKFTMFFLAWAMLWNLWAVLIGNNIIINGLLLLVYFSLISYLMSPSVNYYFSTVFQYGKYMLYTRRVNLKSGIDVPIYFFSKKIPNSGRPVQMPAGYSVKENSRSHMPYLIKKKHLKNNNQSAQKQNKRSIIYVVKQNHLADYNWQVKGKQNIISNHKTKIAAIKKARQAALIRHSRILVQNRYGKFHFGFTPKNPKNHQ